MSDERRFTDAELTAWLLEDSGVLLEDELAYLRGEGPDPSAGHPIDPRGEEWWRVYGRAWCGVPT